MTSVRITVDSPTLGETTIHLESALNSFDDTFALRQIDGLLTDAATRIRRAYFIDTITPTATEP